MSKKQLSTTFYCFSAPVMIATFLIEIIAAVYVLWRYKMNEITRLVALILVFLATFQLAEFMVCEGAGGGLAWMRAGYIAITLLPPLGIHLAYALAGAKRRPLMWPAYAAGAAFIYFFAFVGSSLNGHVCAGNYIIFDIAPGAGLWYSVYYYGLLAVGICIALRNYRQEKNRRVRRALVGLMAGYVAFIVPTATVNLLNFETVRAIPSIMCGFAVLLAVLLVFVVMPAAARKKK